jgi:succinylglutamic semialdehyde dehydrogenase
MKYDHAIDAAVAAAREALPQWIDTPIAERVRILSAFADELRNHKSELAETISTETGKPRWESLTEVDAMINKVALSIRAHDERRKPTTSESAGATSATRYKPHGVAAVLGPFNFPGHLPNGHIVPALLAGNTIVFKPSEHTPKTAEQTIALWHRSGLPLRGINLLQGEKETGAALVTHPGIDAVFFTGSFAVGRAINRALADHPGKIAALEMGGNNPLIVWNATDLKAAAYLTIQSAYLTAGQRCSCARRLIVSSDASGDLFLDALLAMMSKIRVGMPSDEPEPFMGPVINAAAAQRLLRAQESLLPRGARSLAPLQSLRGLAHLLSPALIDVTNVKDRDDDELFGPLLQLIRVKDFDAAIAEANNTRFGLAAGLLSDDRALYDRFYRQAKAGVINFNRPLTGASSTLPFGGVGESGNHRPSAFFAADYCSYPIASLESERVAMPTTLTPGIDLS